MMQALELFTTLKSEGIKLKARDGQLLFAPANKVNDDLRAQIRTHKGELLALLAANDANRYAHLITCQQCEHLAVSGYCKVQGRR